MRYRSRMGFGDVDWPWWHDVVIVVIVLSLIVLVAHLA